MNLPRADITEYHWRVIECSAGPESSCGSSRRPLYTRRILHSMVADTDRDGCGFFSGTKNLEVLPVPRPIRKPVQVLYGFPPALRLKVEEHETDSEN
jgi:hypothetical protein